MKKSVIKSLKDSLEESMVETLENPWRNPRFSVSKHATFEDASYWEWPSDIVLADPKLYEPASVDMVIGMEV